MGSIQDKIILITGAKGGLGRAVTKAFLEAGARVVGVSRSIAAPDFPHSNFVAMPAALSNGDAARKVVDSVVERCGRIDGLVNLVGGFAGGTSVAETNDETLERMLDLNFRSMFYLARAVVPEMLKQGSGRILAVGSRAAVEAPAMAAAYGASKAALLSLIRALAAENREAGITANIVLPGTMDTLANRAAMPNADFTQWVQPGQVAAMLVHLASDAASDVTGAAIPIFGREGS